MQFSRVVRSLLFRSLLCMGLRVGVCASVLVVSGCGWHLQGSTKLPASMVAIEIDATDRYSDFYRELRDSLLAAGAQLTPQTKPSAIVHVKTDQAGQRLSSVSTSNRPEQYEVYYRIVYSLEVDGMETIADQPLELTTNYSYDTTAVLAKQREQLSIQQALARELASQVLRRLTQVTTNAQAGNVARS